MFCLSLAKHHLLNQLFQPAWTWCRLLIPALVMIALAGCAAFQAYPERATDPETDLMTLEPQIGGEAIAACLDNPTSACRNKIIAARMYATDVRFSEFEETLFRQTREAGFGATLATLGLTSTAAFVSGGASQVLAGLAAIVVGGREAYQREVLAERTVIAIHTAMRARRAQAALRLRAGLRQSIDDYPVAVALADLNEYYNAGTVLGALIGITETVGAEARQAEERLLELAPLSRVSFESEPTAVRQAMLARVDALPQADAIALVTTPPAPVNDDMQLQAETIDPFNQRQNNATVAKAVLKAWLSHTVPVEDYSRWATAMNVVP